MKNKIEAIAKILKNHNVPFYIKNNRIYADSMMGGTVEFETVEDLTEFTKVNLYNWLGY